MFTSPADPAEVFERESALAWRASRRPASYIDGHHWYKEEIVEG